MSERQGAAAHAVIEAYERRGITPAELAAAVAAELVRREVNDVFDVNYVMPDGPGNPEIRARFAELGVIIREEGGDADATDDPARLAPRLDVDEAVPEERWPTEEPVPERQAARNLRPRGYDGRTRP